ncbi:MAG: tetratricopeptide repeat protein [Acidobacteriota bacterium]
MSASLAFVGSLLFFAGCATSAPDVREQPTTSEDQLDFGVSMARRGLWSEALFRFRQAERLRPGDARILNNMAVSYEALGQFENALDHYQQAIRADPGDRDLKRNYSRFVEFYRAFKPDDQKDASLDP